MQILSDQAARGAPVTHSATAFITLSLLALAYLCLGWLRLRSLSRPQQPAAKGKPVEVVVFPGGHVTGFGGIIIGEIRRILGGRGVKGLMVMGPLLYGVFYPQPYLGQTLRHIPIAVVDLDRTELSRQLIMTLDADEAVHVAVRAETLAEAQQELFLRHAFGIIEIPAGTTREFLKGNPARLPAYVDSAYFLVFSRVLQGIAESGATVTTDLASHHARKGGDGDRLIALISPASILPVPLFNPTGGYASYVVPAAFVLILQQTLLMGAAMLGGVAFEQGGRDLVQAPRNRRRPVHCDLPAAILSRRRVLACGSDPSGHAPDRDRLSVRIGDRRHGAHQSDVSKHRRGIPRLVHPARPPRDLFSVCRRRHSPPPPEDRPCHVAQGGESGCWRSSRSWRCCRAVSACWR